MYASDQNRTLPALAALAMVGAIAAVLISGLRPQWRVAMRSALIAVDMVTAPPPPPARRPPPPPASATASAPKGDPGARAMKNRASPVFVPPVQPALILPPPIIAAPVTNLGTAASNGASTLPGTGQGAGDAGSGPGGGGTGGSGSGAGSGGAVKGPRQISGKLSYADLPQGLIAPGQQASVAVHYTVRADGGVSDCTIDATSGFSSLDATACALITARFRFRPAVDRAGHPVAATVAEEHAWIARERD